MASLVCRTPALCRTMRAPTLPHASRQHLLRTTASRTFASATSQKKDIGPGRDHVLDKPAKGDHKTNIQSEQSQKGRDSHAQGGADTATAQKDTSGQAEKIREEHPEAPDAIGFQDHRGGKVG